MCCIRNHTYLLNFYCVLKPGKYKGTHSIFSLLKQTWAHMYGTQTIAGTEVYVVLGNTVQLSEISPIHFSRLFIIETTTSVHRDMYFYHSTRSTELQLLICTAGRHQWMPTFWLQVSHFSHLSPLGTSRMSVTLQSLHHHFWKWNGVKKWQSHVTPFCIWRFSIKLPFLILPSALSFKSKTLVRKKLLKSMTSLSVLSKKKKKKEKQTNKIDSKHSFALKALSSCARPGPQD